MSGAPPEPPGGWPEYLDAEETELGLIAIRRQPLPSGELVTELMIEHRFLMSSVTATSERRMSELAIDWHGGDDLDVLVGGLGMGHTADAALATGRVGKLVVVELLPAVIRWFHQGFVPLGAALSADPRLLIEQDDVYRRLMGPPTRTYDVILVDVDHAPDDPLGTWPNPFYKAPSIRNVRRHLNPGGVFAVWSAGPDVTFVQTLREVFAEVEPVAVPFVHAMDGSDDTNLVFLAR